MPLTLMNSNRKENMKTRTVVYTDIEFGHCSLIMEALGKAKTQKEHKKLMSSLLSFAKSMSNLSLVYRIPKNAEITAVSKELSLNTFPSEVAYYITFISREEEE